MCGFVFSHESVGEYIFEGIVEMSAATNKDCIASLNGEIETIFACEVGISYIEHIVATFNPRVSVERKCNAVHNGSVVEYHGDLRLPRKKASLPALLREVSHITRNSSPV